MENMISYIQDPKSGQTMGVISELQSATRELLVGNFAQKGNLSMRKLIREKGGRAIFIEYDLGIGGVLTPIYRLLFDLAIKEALCRERNEGSVYFIMDEFSLLPHLQHIDDGVNFGRSLGARFIIGAQNISQVYDAYGTDRANSLLSGFSTTICFRLNDGKSREFFKELNGKNGRITSYDAMVKAKGQIDQYREAYVVEDYDIDTLQIGEAIIHSGAYAPFRFHFKLFEGK
jgi:type IV secretory pathway TraG/TraD family ATPase VirD4